jgi:stage II sporulation protein M
MVKKRGFSFAREYALSWKYLKEAKNIIYWSMAMFFLFFLVGFFIAPSEVISNSILNMINELLELTKGMSGFELIKFIFLNNVKVGFMGMIFGVALGILPIFLIITNGYVLGFVANLVVAEEGILSLWRLLPHGIFELPAIFISLGLGIKLGSFIFQVKKAESFRYYFWNSLRVFFFVILPLLIIAAIIEGALIALG